MPARGRQVLAGCVARTRPGGALVGCWALGAMLGHSALSGLLVPLEVALPEGIVLRQRVVDEWRGSLEGSQLELAA